MAVASDPTAAAEKPSTGVSRQGLVTKEQVKGAKILLDRIAIAPGASIRCAPSADAIIWCRVLNGEVALDAPAEITLSDGHSAMLPPGLEVTITSAKGATVLLAEIVDFRGLVPKSSQNTPYFNMIDWTNAEVFEVKSDGRKRIRLASLANCGTTAFKVDQVIFPPGSSSPSAHREGADTLLYVTAGNGVATVAGQRFPLREGVSIYVPAGERHSVQAGSGGELHFLQFDAPAEFKTVWADPSQASTWQATGLDIKRREPGSQAPKHWAGSGWLNTGGWGIGLGRPR